MAKVADGSDASSSDTEEFLKCPICLEFYVDPRNLPCLHTFCKACLQTYITSSLKEETSGTKLKVVFACPVCRDMVTSSYPEGCKVDELASQLPKNQTISSLLDKHNLETNVKYCDPCLADKSENPAKTWCKVCVQAFCDDCTKYHRKISVLKNHKLVQLSDMDASDLDITWQEFCDIHKDEVLKAFCKDHDIACCVTCVTIEHRKCDDVMTLEAAAEGIREMTETQDFLKQLQGSENGLSEMLQIRKQNVSGLEAQKEIMLMEIEAFRKRLDDHFNKLEIKLREDVASEHKKVLLEENDLIADLESKYATVMNYRKLFEACLQKAPNVHLLIEMKKLVKKTKIFGNDLKCRVCNMNEFDLQLRFQHEIKNMLSILNLGTVEVHTKLPRKNFDFLHSKFFSKQEVSEVSTFQLQRKIQSATFLENGEIILTMAFCFVICDKNGEYMTATEVLGALRMNGVTVFTDDTILLSRSGADIVYKVNIITEKFQDWKTKFKCENIVNAGERVIAACETNIVVLDFTGNAVQNIPIRGTTTRNIAFHGGIIYYTVSDENVVRAVSLNGIHEVGFEYKNPDLRDPRGIDTDTKGNIYVAGFASCNVHQISKDGQLLNILLTDIVNPNGICVSKTGDHLMVSHSETKVSVYELI